ncbi:MAG: hypothetical protein AABY16_00780 [Nanoarchaeota archaeon]
MPDMQKLLQTKERIVEIIKQRGPELPVRVASAIGTNNLFTAAFMSELVGEQRLKISHMRVGASPLYYTEGQEEQLQKYIDYLNHREKEAFNLLKQNSILQDSEQEPAIRVALRSIKDFAVPVQIKEKEETKIFWKLHTIPNEAAKDLIEQKLNPNIIAKEKKVLEKQTELKKESEVQTLTEAKEKKKKAQKKEKLIDTKFKDNIVDYIKSKDIEILQEISVDKKEFISKIRIDMPLGKQEFYLISKDKKTISTEEIALALQKAQQERMPALFLSPGKLNKSAREYLKEWKNLIKFEQVKF